MLSSLAPARRRLVLAAGALVLVAAVVLGVVLLTRGGDDPAGPAPQQQAGPVVLVPGYGGSTTGLQRLAATLRDDGKDATVMSLPGDGRGDLDAQARALAEIVDSVRERTGARSVDVIGYSAGGVVARLWVASHGGADVARRVITLGSPHHGTAIASLAGSLLPSACPTACRQLTPDSPLLERLNAGDETPAGPSWVSIWSDRDRVVTPPTSARLDGALNITLQSVCPGNRAGHGDLPTDGDVAAIVAAELAPGPPRAPTAADCVSS